MADRDRGSNDTAPTDGSRWWHEDSRISRLLTGALGLCFALTLTLAYVFEEPLDHAPATPPREPTDERSAEPSPPAAASALQTILLPEPPPPPRPAETRPRASAEGSPAVTAPQPREAPKPEPSPPEPLPRIEALAKPEPQAPPARKLTPLANDPNAPEQIAENEDVEAALRKAAKVESAAEDVAVHAPALDPSEPRVEVDLADRRTPEAREGRALLRILEHGAGPEIAIAWPASPRDRRALYARFTSCYGVRTALLDSRGRLYAAGRRGVWIPNTDRYSGFMRAVSGELSQAEKQKADAIRRSHPEARRAAVVRLFPRSVDAILLGGLHSLLEGRYEGARRISARYVLDARSVRIQDLWVDGVRAPGAIEIAPPAGCATL